ncbi:MAG: endonuclease [Bacteroidales bacterium]|nr:endonuclease [Bacteroidales bacterium]
MKKITILLFIYIFINLSTLAQIPTGYYDDAEGLTGEDLRTALQTIISSPYSSQSYSALWTAFYSTDVKANGKVWDMYSDVPGGTPAYEYTFGSDQCGSYSGEGSCYNREHSFPKSWFGEDLPMNTDLFHLYPTDGYVNGRRSNYPYGITSTPSWTSTNGSKVGPCYYSSYTGTIFEPIDEYKGDFARTYFYMVTRYKDLVSGWSSAMLSGNTLSEWALNMLLEWHTNDPVNQKETDRNNAVHDIQENRNPFIDHPEYVGYIWEGGVPDNPPVISNITNIPQYPTSDDNVTVTAQITDNGSVVSANLKWCTDGTSFNITISMTDPNTDDIYETVSQIPAQSNGTTVYYKIEATDNDDSTTTSSIQTYSLSNETILIDEDFTTCPPPDWIIYSVASNKDWVCSSAEMSINAYGGDVASNDWLITPSLNLSEYQNGILTFKTWTYYTDAFYPPLTLKYSVDYTGSGDPSSATWTELSYTASPEGSDTWTNSGNIDLSGISCISVYIAFHYTSTGTEAGTSAYWKLDDVKISAESGGSDNTPPEFISTYPKAVNITDYTVNVVVQLNEPGTVYFLVLSDGETEPLPADVQAGTTINVTNSSTSYSEAIIGLSPETAYDIYFIAEDDETEPNVQDSLTKLDVTTTLTDNQPPEFISNYPLAENITDNTVDVVVKLNEPGTVYFLVLSDGDPEPSIADVQAGTTISVTDSSTDYSETTIGLSPETAYDIYFIAEDDETEPNVQTTLTKLDVTTTFTDITPPEFIEDYPKTQNIGGTSFDIAAQLDEPGLVFYLVLSDGATEPSVDDLKNGDTIIVSNAQVEYFSYINELTPETNYDIYLIAQDNEDTPNIQTEKTKLEVSTSVEDLIAPAFIDGYPMVDNINPYGSDIIVQLDEKGTVYYLVQTTGTTSPTISQVKEGIIFEILSSSTDYVSQINGLSPETEYDIYLIAEDDETVPNVQETTVKLSFTTLGEPPLITSNPTDKNVCISEEVLFEVSATGEEPITYQWKKDSLIIAGEISNSYSITNVTVDDKGYYFCAVSNNNGTVYTDSAELTVDIPPYAGNDTAVNVCNTETSVNLLGFLTDADSSGIWFDNDNTNALTNGIFNATVADTGSYNFTYLVLGGACENDYASLVVNVVNCNSIEDIYSNNIFKIYPNPNNGNFYIDFLKENDLIIKNIKIINSLGQLIYSKDVNTNESNDKIHIQNIPTGIYLIKFVTNKYIFIKKVMVI